MCYKSFSPTAAQRGRPGEDFDCYKCSPDTAAGGDRTVECAAATTCSEPPAPRWQHPSRHPTAGRACRGRSMHLAQVLLTEATRRGQRRGQRRGTHGHRAGGSEGWRWRGALAAAGPGKGRVRQAGRGCAQYLGAMARKSDEGQTGSPEAAGRAQDRRSRPAELMERQSQHQMGAQARQISNAAQQPVVPASPLGPAHAPCCQPLSTCQAAHTPPPIGLRPCRSMGSLVPLHFRVRHSADLGHASPRPSYSKILLLLFTTLL